MVAVRSATPEQLGSVPVGQQAVRTLVLENTTAGRVRLGVERVSCGCVSARFDRSDIGPGKAATLSITVNVEAGRGAQHQAVRVRVLDAADESRSDHLTFHVRYSPELDFYVFPTEVKLQLREGVDGATDVYIRPHSDQNVRPMRAISTLADVRISEFEALDTGAFRARLTVRGSAVGIQRGHLLIYTNSPTYPLVRVPVGLRIEPAWWSEPGGIVLDLTSDDETLVRASLRIRGVPAFTAERIARVDEHQVAPGVFATISPSVADPRLVVLLVRVEPWRLPSPSGQALVELSLDRTDVPYSLPIVWFRSERDRAGARP